MIKLFFLPLLAGKFLIATSDVSSMIVSMEKMRFPKPIIIPIAVMFRYFPAFKDDKKNVKMAMKMRGITVYYVDGGTITRQFSKVQFFKLDDAVRRQLGLRAIDFVALQNKVAKTAPTGKQLLIDRIDYPLRDRALKMSGIAFNYGSIIGIYGYNGVGKSSFIRLLMGLEKRAKAKILIGDKALSGKQRLKRSYLVMQDVNHQLFTDSVITEVSLGMADKYDALAVERILKGLNIYDLKDKHPLSLSGGQKQRVAVASAILSGAEIICFDEPTSGMDYDNMIKISQLIKQTIDNDTIIFVISHDHEFLNNTADQICALAQYNQATL